MFANDGFKIRGWDETGLHVGSARHFGLLAILAFWRVRRDREKGGEIKDHVVGRVAILDPRIY